MDQVGVEDAAVKRNRSYFEGHAVELSSVTPSTASDDRTTEEYIKNPAH